MTDWWIDFPCFCCCSVPRSCLTLYDPRNCSTSGFPSFTISQSLLNSRPLSQWCHPTILSSVTSLSSCPQSFPASGYRLVNWFFTSGRQNIGTAASASVLPMNIHGWYPLGWTGLISLQSKGLSRVFSNTTARKHQFFGTQPSLWSNCHIHSWLLGKP